MAKAAKQKTRAQVEAMQDKAVRFLRDVADKPDAADDIEDMSVEEYARKKHVTISNPRRTRKKNRKPSVGSGERFAALERKLAARPDIQSPRALAAAIGRRKYGKRKFQQLAARGRRRRANPDGELDQAAGLYKKFHGRGPKEVIELQLNEQRRGTYTALGELQELRFKLSGRETIRLGFEGNHVKVASSPDGKQLYFIGGDQVMDEKLLKSFGEDPSKDIIPLGECPYIAYVTRKAFDGFKEAIYYHHLGEDGGWPPEGFYDRLNKTIVLAGGSYYVAAPGIMH
jgi:hypothetical protein